MFLHSVGVFLTYLEVPSSHIRFLFSSKILRRSEGLPERDMESLRMMGWGLVVAGSSSAAAAVVAVAVPRGGWAYWRRRRALLIRVMALLQELATTIRVCYYYKSLLRL